MAGEWPQRVITFTRWSDAENVAVQRLHPHLSAATGLCAHGRSCGRRPRGGSGLHPASTYAVALDRLLNAIVADGLVNGGRPASTNPRPPRSAAPPAWTSHTSYSTTTATSLAHLARLHTAPEPPDSAAGNSHCCSPAS